MAQPPQSSSSWSEVYISDEEEVRQAIDAVQNLTTGSLQSHDVLDTRIERARQLINFFDSTNFMDWPDRYDDQVLTIRELQNLAYREADSGGIQDIAQWCLRQYLHILNSTGNGAIEVLTGLGQAWLYRAQASVARIHRLEGSSSSATSSGRPASSGGRLSYTSSDEAREAERAVVEADIRAGTADYVEARGMLLPATEYLHRAVRAAERTERLTGELLSVAAEAFMSLGNVSFSHHSEQFFQQAVRYLQMATEITGFQLSSYLQGYLDDFGRLVEHP